MVGENYWKRAWESHGQIWGLLCRGEGPHWIRAIPGSGKGGHSWTVALEVDMDGLGKDLRSIYFKILFTYIKKSGEWYCSLRCYITV